MRFGAQWRLLIWGALLDNEENYLIKKLFTGLGIVQIENRAGCSMPFHLAVVNGFAGGPRPRAPRVAGSQFLAALARGCPFPCSEVGFIHPPRTIRRTQLGTVAPVQFRRLNAAPNAHKTSPAPIPVAC